MNSLENKTKVYAAGLLSYLEPSRPILFYIDKKEKDSSKVVLDLVKELLRPKYKGILLS